MGPWWGLASLSIIALSCQACVEDGHKRLHVWSLTWTVTSRRICVNLVVLDFTSETMAQSSGMLIRHYILCAFGVECSSLRILSEQVKREREKKADITVSSSLPGSFS
ncbi:hypothetical protein B0H10DRAFT_1955942 [Mycena sp. CBHHK59/15]|nr:hypothetical protein B0H10DRAFT_1955942 [Mycena sp. CBHHK59/15]